MHQIVRIITEIISSTLKNHHEKEETYGSEMQRRKDEQIEVLTRENGGEVDGEEEDI